MKTPWEFDREEVPDDAGVENRRQRRTIRRIAAVCWTLLLVALAVVALVWTGHASVAPRSVDAPGVTFDVGEAGLTLVVDAGGGPTGIVIRATPPGVSILVAGQEVIGVGA